MNVMIYLDTIVEIYHPAEGQPRRGRGQGRGRGGCGCNGRRGANAVANEGPLADAYAQVDDEVHQQDDNQAENESWGVDGDADLNNDEEDEATRFSDVFEEEIGE